MATLSSALLFQFWLILLTASHDTDECDGNVFPGMECTASSSTSSNTSHATAISEGSCSSAFAQFASDHLSTDGNTGGASKSSNELGYSVPSDFLSGREIVICPLPENATLQTDGMQTLNVRAALSAEGLTEKNMDPQSKAHRLIVGKVLLREIEALFDLKAFHLADTSRVDGGAVYGEATVRDTASRTLRKAHHSFHIDKHFAGICKLYDCSSNEEAVRVIIESMGHLWAGDLEAEQVDVAELEYAMLNGRSINVWLSLTPGHIEQSPLVLVDPTSIRLSHDAFYTMKVNMPGLVGSISLLKLAQSESARFHWIPNMEFGDVLVFSNSMTPHSAVRVLNGSDKSRRSAEMRMVLIDRASKEEL